MALVALDKSQGHFKESQGLEILASRIFLDSICTWNEYKTKNQ